MKKTVSIILSILIISFAFCSCSSKPNAELTDENVTKTVDTAFEALKDFDTDELETYVDSSTLNIIIGYAKQHDQFKKLGEAIFANLSYEIKNIDLQNKQVTISVINKDLYLTASEFTNNLLNSYSKFQLLTKLANDNWLDITLAELTESINSAAMEASSTEITLNIIQNKNNLVLTFDETAEDEVSGGALGAIKSGIAG